MALELPPELESVLGLLGIDWPQANEDEVARLADEIRKLASTLDTVQLGADKAVGALGEVYQGASADNLKELWQGVSKFSGLVVEACGVIANALNAGALVIEGCKGATVAQLVATQGEMAAASFTGPGGEAAIIAAAKQMVSSILEAAVSAFGQALAQPISDLVENVAKAVIPTGTVQSIGAGFGVNLGQLANSASQLVSHATDIDSHGKAFSQIVGGLDLGNPGDAIGKLVVEAAEQIATTIGTEIVKKLLSLFTGTADKLSQVGRNLTDHEDSHVQQLNGILAGQNSPNPASPLKLSGGAHTLAGGGSITLDSVQSGDDLAALPQAVPVGQQPDQGAAPRTALPHPGPGYVQTTNGVSQRLEPSRPHAPGVVNSPAGYGHPGGGGGAQPPAGGGQVRAAVLEKQRTTRQEGPDDGILAEPIGEGDAAQA